MKRRPTRGIRGRLLLAFGFIAALTVVCAIVGWISYRGLGSNIDRIVFENLPAAALAAALAEAAAAITATTPMLAVAANDDERTGARDALFARLRVVDGLVGRLDAVAARGETPATLRALYDDLEANLRHLDGNVGERLQLRQRNAQLARRLRWVHADFIDELDPMLEDARFNIDLTLARSADRTGLGPEQRTGIGDATRRQAALLEVKATGNLAVGLLGRIGTLEDAQAIDGIEHYLREVLAELELHMKSLEPLAEALSLRHVVTDIGSFAGGERSLFALRRAELAGLQTGRSLVGVNRALIRRLQNHAGARVSAGAAQTLAAAQESRRSIRDGKLALLAAAVLSLAVAGLVVWLYVGRSIVARLTALSDAMLAIAGGDLDTTIPPSGGDEIGAMAEALGVFRDTAFQMTHEARTRLVDAIETIQEGFALYDRTDRLVLCNTRYRELLYPGIEDVMTPGTPFETVARTAAERGLIRDAEGRVEQWVRERMALHEKPGEPHLQERSDGRWILVNERKTEGGGMVAVYSDITVLKRAEIEATDADLAKTDFLRAVAHELNNLLNPIVQFLRLVRDSSADRLDERQAANLEKSLLCANELTLVIQAIGWYLTHRPPEPKMAPIEPLVDECLSFVEIKLSPEVTSIKEIEPGLPDLWVDAFMLKRILSNLLSNAVKCTEQGSITTSVRRVRDEVVFVVADTGCGIAEEHQATIFDKDVQLRQERGGSGLGLAICRDFADRIGGAISVRSRVDVGSVFAVTVPLRQRPAADGHASRLAAIAGDAR